MKDVFEIYLDIQNSNMPADTKKILSDMVKVGNKRNTTGIVQIDKDTKEEIARHETRSKANLAIGKPETSSGIGDALLARTGKHFAYGYLWCHASVWEDMTEEERKAYV